MTPDPRPRARTFARATLIAVSMLGATTARAVETDESEPSATSRGAARKNVELVIVGRPADAKPLEDAILELLGRKDLTVVHDRDGVPAATVLARVAIDLEAKDEARVFVSRGRAGLPLVSRTVPRSDNPAVVREALAQTVRAAVEAEMLAEEGRLAAPAPTLTAVAEPTPPPAPVVVAQPREPVDVAEPPAAPAPRSRLAPWGVELTTFAAGGPFAEDAGPVIRAGVGASIGSRRGLGPTIALSAAYAVPFRVQADVLTSHADLAFVRLVPSLTVARFTAATIEVGLGGGVDVLTVEATSSELPAQTIEDQTTRVNPVLSSLLSVHVALVESVALTVSGAIDVELSSRRYVLDDRGTRTDVFVPWRVRPALVLGFAFTVAGEPAFQPKMVAAR